MSAQKTCKARVPGSDGWWRHTCSRRATTKDGYCFQHSPAEVRRRRDEQQRKYKVARKRDVYARLERVATLLDAIKRELNFKTPLGSEALRLERIRGAVRKYEERERAIFDE